MRKIRLTEKDLHNIVKRVLNEQGNMFGTAGVGMDSPFMSNKSYEKPKSKPKENINPKNPFD